MDMSKLSKIMTATALAAVTATSFSIPAEARHHRHHYYGRTAYAHRVCRRSPATTGKVVGGVAGAVVGHSLIGHGLLGTAAGAVGGVVAGGAVDRSMTSRYRCYYVR
jgi:outer membrane lipoprotein SlyB